VLALRLTEVRNVNHMMALHDLGSVRGLGIGLRLDDHHTAATDIADR